MITDVARRERLRHNPLNEVTATVERVTGADGTTMVRKQLRRPTSGAAGPTPDPGAAPGAAPGAWAASTDPRHWNYWRREAEAYASAPLRAGLRAAGLDLPVASVVEFPDGATLWLEDVAGTPGPGFDLADHAALAAGLGRWQAQGPLEVPWASRRFLRDYSGSKPAPWHLLDDDDAWQQPLVRAAWPAGLRAGWARLVGHRDRLLDAMERLPRTHSHLDLWVANLVRRPAGTGADAGRVVLLDWAFCGDGAFGEDLGNHLPDAVFDLFWPAERLAELEEVCFPAYLAGLREAGRRGDVDDVRLGLVASWVKYAWLLPLMLAHAGDGAFRAYHEPADGEHLYRQRGLALAHLVGWCDEALRLLP